MNDSTKHELLSTEVVKHIANLSRITLTEEELQKSKEDLGSIFQHLASLNEIDTTDVEPLDHPTQLLNRNREDVVGSTLSCEQVLENAPAVRGAYIDVPKVLGGKS